MSESSYLDDNDIICGLAAFKQVEPRPKTGIQLVHPPLGDLQAGKSPYAKEGVYHF